MNAKLKLPPDLLRAAQCKAVEEGKSLDAVVDEALSAYLEITRPAAFRLRKVTFSEPRLQVQAGWENTASHLYPCEPISRDTQA